MKRLLCAPAQWLEWIDPIDPKEELLWALSQESKKIDEIFCRIGKIGAFCQQNGIPWHGWEEEQSFLEQAILRVGFDVSQKRLPPPSSSSFIVGLFAPFSRLSQSELCTFSILIKEALQERATALFELWWQYEDFSPRPIMDTYNGSIKLVRALKPTRIDKKVQITSHWMVGCAGQQPQRFVYEETRYLHQHKDIHEIFSWGRCTFQQYKDRTYLWVHKA